MLNKASDDVEKIKPIKGTRHHLKLKGMVHAFNARKAVEACVEKLTKHVKNNGTPKQVEQATTLNKYRLTQQDIMTNTHLHTLTQDNHRYLWQQVSARTIIGARQGTRTTNHTQDT